MTGRVLRRLHVTTLGLMAVASLACAGWAGDFRRIPGHSMAPTLLAGDHVRVDPDRSSLQVGDIIAFRHPQRDGTVVVKRVVALAGDLIEVNGHQITRNGEVQAMEDRDVSTATDDRCVTVDTVSHVEKLEGRAHRIRTPPDGGGRHAHMEGLTVPPDTVFVMGDNRGSSEDSRSFGAVPRGHVLGVVTTVLHSMDDCTGKARRERFGLVPE